MNLQETPYARDVAYFTRKLHPSVISESLLNLLKEHRDILDHPYKSVPTPSNDFLYYTNPPREWFQRY